MTFLSHARHFELEINFRDASPVEVDGAGVRVDHHL